MLTWAWITAARLRRRIGKPPLAEWERDRDAWIRAHAPGRSFADVGGLFGIHGRRAFLAEEAGAEPVTVFDAGDPVYGFEQERERRGSAVRFVQGDLEDPEAVAGLGTHQVVWCTGIIYHSPNPVRQLMHLREVTSELLYLGTHTIPEVPGIPNACIYYANLPERARRAIATAHQQTDRLWGVGTPFRYEPMRGHGNFWWGITPSALRAMLATARFEVVEERRVHAWPFYVDLVARPVDEHPLLPPLDYYRRRGQRRERGEQQLPWEDFYERQEPR